MAHTSSAIAVVLSYDARASLLDLLEAGAGQTESEVLDKLLTQVLPTFRSQHLELSQVRAALETTHHELQEKEGETGGVKGEGKWQGMERGASESPAGGGVCHMSRPFTAADCEQPCRRNCF